MGQDNVVDFKTPEPFVDDPLTDVLRTGARKLLTEALETEIEGFLSQYRDLRDSQDRQRVVRNGYLPERDIQPGIANRTVNQVLFDLHPPCCLPIFEKQRAWKS